MNWLPSLNIVWKAETQNDGQIESDSTELVIRSHTAAFVESRKRHNEIANLLRESLTARYQNMLRHGECQQLWQKGSKCNICKKVLVLKHHCRLCGYVICSKCSRNQQVLRLCTSCHKDISSKNKHASSPIEDIYEQIIEGKRQRDTDALYSLQQRIKLVSCRNNTERIVNMNIARSISQYLSGEIETLEPCQKNLELLIEEYLQTKPGQRKRVLEREISRIEYTLYGESKFAQ